VKSLAALALGAALLGLPTGCAKSAGAQQGGSPVARIDGQPITEAELGAEAKPALAAVDARYAEETHNVKSRALDALIDRRLLEAAAKKKGLTPQQYFDAEVASRIPPAPEAYLRSVYDQTKATGRQVPPFEQVKDEIATFVKNQDLETGRQKLAAKLRAESKVERLLPPLIPPKVEVRPNGPSRGPESAAVTLGVFSDYQCPFCAQAEPVVRQLLDAYRKDVRLVFQSYPLSIHPDAPKASEAALCAGEQGRYWEMHDALFAHQQALKPADLRRYAADLGLDAASFGACLDAGRTAHAVAASRALGDGLGIDSTPRFFVNGRPLVGAQSFERLREIVDYELASAKR
jgi:protein-disulfide isomerase